MHYGFHKNKNKEPIYQTKILFGIIHDHDQVLQMYMNADFLYLSVSAYLLVILHLQ